jgi:DNA invertase Pin-like site-specific DNA recombinase
MVCSGDIGAVYCIEASRLARNGRDWHHLIELCALAGTLVIDPEGAYDPRIVNDRLLLGLKGTMSEYELNLMRQRGWRLAPRKRGAASSGSCFRPASAGARAARSRSIPMSTCRKPSG